MFVPLGTGDVDVTGIVAALEGAGYRGWYVLEQDVMLPGEPDGEGPVADVRRCLAYLTEGARVTTVQHWIAGSLTDAGSTRDRAGLQPGHRPGRGRRAAGRHGGRRPRDRRRLGGVPGLVADLGECPHQDHVRLPRAGERPRQRLAEVITDEHGKVLSDALGEVQRGLEVVEFACGIPSLLKGDYSDQVSTGVDTFSFREPLGVCAGITPFNFPAMVPMWMFPVAIACGNTFVLKPSERTRRPRC
jgi:malonate-semialdehyde dehydrogenase (acetylating)/methylmalonate-semialdehyde dehydrogenase